MKAGPTLRSGGGVVVDKFYHKKHYLIFLFSQHSWILSITQFFFFNILFMLLAKEKEKQKASWLHCIFSSLGSFQDSKFSFLYSFYASSSKRKGTRKSFLQKNILGLSLFRGSSSRPALLSSSH